MAAPKENLMSVGHLSGNERITFTKQRGHGLNKSVYRPDFSTPQSHQNVKVMHLQQRWQELKEREHIAQQHNWQLLQQFEEAQDTLREMLARNAAMKTIRIEYERYLKESAPRWEQQLKEKTQAAQRKRTEEYLRSCQKNTEEQQMKKSPADRRLLSQGLTKKPQTVSAPQENNNQNINLDYDQDVFSHLPYVQSSWLTHTQSQTARFPNRVPGQPRGSSYVPPSYLPSPSILPHPHQFQLHHPGHHHFWPRQDPPDWASPQSNYPSSWITGAAGILSGSEALWGQLYTEEPPHEREAEAETSRAPSSKRERSGGSRSSHLSQELDIKPVRLSSDHAESSEGGRDSSQASREKKRRRRGKTQQSSSDRERCSSQKSSTASSAIIAGAAMVQSSESEASSEKGSAKCSRSTRRRSMGLSVGSLRTEMTVKGRSNDDNSTSHKDECRSTAEESGSPDQSKSENVENQSPVDKSDSHREEESESVSLKMEKQESSSSEESGAEEKDEEYQKDLGKEDDDNDDGEEKEKSWRDEEQDKRNVCASDDKVSARKNRMEEEDDTREEDESEEEGDDEDDDKLKSEEGENRKPASVSSQDEEEDEDERDVNKMGGDESDEEEEEEEEEEEQKSDEAGKPEETRDSDDSIISPQDNRLKKIHIIPEEAAEDDNNDDDKSGSKSGSSDEDSNELSEEEEEEEEEEEDNHIEDLLAPQEQTNKKEKDLKVDDKPKVTCDAVEVFQAELTDHQSDSDEFDHFYD